MEITYSKYEHYYLPDLAASQEEPATYGRFGRMRLKYLKEHRRAAYINLKTSGQLTHHLNEIDREANEMLRLLIEEMARAQGVTEQLKDENVQCQKKCAIGSVAGRVLPPLKQHPKRCACLCILYSPQKQAVTSAIKRSILHSKKSCAAFTLMRQGSMIFATPTPLTV